MKDVNKAYSLAKDKKTGEWRVCTWVNQSLWDIITNKKVCNVSDMCRWRYFKELSYHKAEAGLKLGGRICKEDERGFTEWFYILQDEEETREEGKYLVGI